MRYHARDLCDQIVQRRRDLRAAGVNLKTGSLIRSFSNNSVELLTSDELRTRLLSSLEEALPRTITEISEELGDSVDVLYDHHADLCYRTTDRWRDHQSESRRQNIEDAREQVRQVIFELHSQGQAITQAAVVERLSKPAYMRDEEVSSLFYSLKKELE